MTHGSFSPRASQVSPNPSKLATIKVEDLTITFPSSPGSNQRSHPGSKAVVNHVSFELKPGSTLGIVGESGSGKTMTALALLGLLPPLAQLQGHILYQPSTSAPIELTQLSPVQMSRYRGDQIAMIFQEPMSSLDPVYTCGYQVQETILANESVTLAEAEQRTQALFEEVQLSPDLRYRYPFQLSGGQMQRVAIAAAIACNPALLLADEPTTALDVTVQAEILALLRKLQARRQMSMIFISHDLGIIAEVANQVLVMYQGTVVEQGSVTQLFQNPQHPYTQGLLACRPVLDRRLSRLPTVADFISSAGSTPQAKSSLSVAQALNIAEITAAEVNERVQALQKQPPLLQVSDLKTYFPITRGVFKQVVGEVKAVDGVSFKVYPGETLGLVGESGCGKSTLVRTVLRLVRATAGQIIYDGDDLLALNAQRMGRLRRDLQLIFQDPFGSLDPRMTVGESVIEPMVLHRIGGNRAERYQRARTLFTQVGLDPESLSRMPHEFSGGQRQRICIARALASEPRLVICDEAVSALDVSVQAQVLNLLKQLQDELKLTYIFISHDLSVVKFMSDRIMVMNRGKIEEIAPADQIYTSPQTDYTRQLIAAVPKLEPHSNVE